MKTETYPNPFLLEKYEGVIASEFITPKQAISLALEGLEIAIESSSLKYQMLFLEKLGSCSFQLGRVRHAKQYYYEALDISVAHFSENKEKIFQILSGLAAVYGFNNEYDIALNYYFKILKYNIEHLNDKIYENIASLHFAQKDYNTALDFLQKGLVIAKKYEHPRIINNILGNIGVIYYHQGYIEKSIDIFKQSYQQAKANQFIRTCIYNLMNIGDIYASKHQIERSKPYYNEALDFILKYDFLHEEAMIYQKIGLNYKQEGNHEVSLSYYKKALKIVKSNIYDNQKPGCYDAIIEIYKELEDYKSAYEYQTEFINYQKRQIIQKKESKLKEKLKEKEDEIDRLKFQNDRMVQQNTLLQQFSHIVAHDLKEPLRNISGFASLIERRYKTVIDQNGQEYLSFIIKNVKRMNDLLSDLLQFVTIDYKETQKSDVDLNEVLDIVKENIRRLIQENQVVLNINNLPTVKGYESHLTQLFQNLIQNAIKFRKKDTPIIITIHVKEKNNVLLFSISDNGIGIPLDRQEKIFEIFKKLHRTEEYSGTGIGLALCKKIIEMHEGKIWVESTVNEGSTFFFTIKTTPSLDKLIEFS